MKSREIGKKSDPPGELHNHSDYFKFPCVCTQDGQRGRHYTQRSGAESGNTRVEQRGQGGKEQGIQGDLPRCLNGMSEASQEHFNPISGEIETSHNIKPVR